MRTEITAPMPGKINYVKTQIGANVSANETLFVIESMKMEINIASPTSGKVKEIYCNVGDSVPKGNLLALIE